jgi:hypothetical protein
MKGGTPDVMFSSTCLLQRITFHECKTQLPETHHFFTRPSECGEEVQH